MMLRCFIRWKIKIISLSVLIWQYCFIWQEEIERTNIAKFSHIWNEFIYSLRDEDLINNMCVFLDPIVYFLGNLLKEQYVYCLFLESLHCFLFTLMYIQVEVFCILLFYFIGRRICCWYHHLQMTYQLFSGLFFSLQAR